MLQKFGSLKYSVIYGLMIQTTVQTCVVGVSGEGTQCACTIGMHSIFQLGTWSLEMVITKLNWEAFKTKC